MATMKDIIQSPLLLALVALCGVLAIRSARRARKSGKCSGCGGNCAAFRHKDKEEKEE